VKNLCFLAVLSYAFYFPFFPVFSPKLAGTGKREKREKKAGKRETATTLSPTELTISLSIPRDDFIDCC
jgi:hypothetical protein